MRTIFLVLLLVVTVSCKKKTAGTQNVSVNESTMNNVSYGSDARQKMDIFLPANRSASSTKTFFVVHGGGWSGGDKAEMAATVTELRKRFPDYAFVNLNYRLASSGGVNVFPAQEQDMMAAINFYLSKSAEYRVSSDIVLFGASAGAHLSLLHAYKNDPQHHVKAVVDAFGPTDMQAMAAQNTNTALALHYVTGFTYEQNPAIYEQSSPVQFVNAACPPTIILQGGADQIVFPAQSTALQSLLEQAGVVNQLVMYPGEGHGWLGANLLDSFAKIEAFVKANVQ